MPAPKPQRPTLNLRHWFLKTTWSSSESLYKCGKSVNEIKPLLRPSLFVALIYAAFRISLRRESSQSRSKASLGASKRRLPIRPFWRCSQAEADRE